MQYFFFSLLRRYLCGLAFISFLQIDALAQVQSKPADKFVDMIGVCVHAARNYSQYTNSTDNPDAEQNTINAISNLRIRHLRDGIYGWNGGVEDFDKDNRGVVTRFSAISQATANAGIPGGVTWIVTDNQDDWQRLRDNYLAPLGNKVTVLEGANENMGTSGDPQAYQQIRDWWNNILPSLPNLKIATNTGPTAACEIATAGSINDYVHFGNAHPYHFWPPFKPWGNGAHCGFNGTCAPPTISLWIAPDNAGGTIGYIAATRKSRVAADKPMIFTEWGYPTISNDANGWGVSELTAAKYMARGFLEHFNAGIVYSCSYELMDPQPVSPFNADPEKHFGLAYNNGALKPSGTAVKRLINLLEDAGNTNISTGTLNYTLSGGGLSFKDDKNATTNEIHQTLLQKGNGKFYLVLWQEAVSTNSSGLALNIPAVNVTVNFGETLIGLKAYLPTTTDNGSPVVNTANVSSYTFSVPDHPLVIEITTANYPVTGVSVSPSAPTLGINETLQLTATLVPANATNRIVSLSTSNAAIATVSTSGLVKAVAAGTATITVTTADGAHIAVSQVTVASFPVTGVSVSPVSKTITINETVQLTATVTPANAFNKNISWSTSDAAIATVSTTGLVTGKVAGTASITVTTTDGSFTAVSQITVNSPPSGTWIIADNKDPNWTWVGLAQYDDAFCFGGTAHGSDIVGSYGSYTFSGTEVEYYSWTGLDGGKMEIFVDNVSKGIFTLFHDPEIYKVKIFGVSNLIPGTHTIKIVTTEDVKWGMVDYIQFRNTFTLPLHLLSFTAQLNNGKSYLRWITENELNLSHFDIERSSDGVRFDKIKALASHGNGSYNIADAAPQKGYNYYRLKMVDKDGKFSYSNVESVKVLNYIDFSFTMYPNPNRGLLIIEPSQSDKPVTVSIFDQQGRLMLIKQITGKTPVDIHNLAKGVYIVRLLNKESEKTGKLIVLIN